MSNKPRHRPPRPRRRDPGYKVVAIDTCHCVDPQCGCRITGRPWSYTVGRSSVGREELVTTGLFNVAVIGYLTHLVAEHLDNVGFPAPDPVGGVIEVLGLPFRLDRVPRDWVLHDPSRIARWFDRFERPGKPLDVPGLVQIVWPDEEGHFPDDPLCGVLERERQVLLAHDPLSYPTVLDDLGLTG